MSDQSNIIENLQPAVQKIWRESGFDQPTSIQEKAIPLILEGKDVIAQSPTGTGKTVAYLLPILEKIDPAVRNAQAIILAPSRELVMQIFQEVQKWSAGTEVKAASLVGGANIKRQLDKLKEKPQIIVGTPGRIMEILALKKLKMHEVKSIVLDEGDQLLAEEHLKDVRSIVKSSLNDRQLLLFSATRLKDTDQIKAITGRDPEFLTIDTNAEGKESAVNHFYLLAEPRDRAKLVQKIAAMPGVKALVFVRDIGNMTVLSEKLAYEKVPLESLHGEMKKQEREKAIKKLKDGKVKLLLATDIAARGLDIDGLTHVIHYDFPSEIDQYVHRSGRTGRMGASGTVVSFVNQREQREIRKYGRTLGVPVQERRIFKGQFTEPKPKK